MNRYRIISDYPIHSWPDGDGDWCRWKDIEHLMRYVEHEPYCKGNDTGECVCGLDALLKEQNNGT